MNCPYCGADSQVLDSRSNAEGVRRRRQCSGCKRRFTTYERVGSPGLKVVKRSGKPEPFDSDKLQRTLARVCRNRPTVARADILRIVRDIEARLVDSEAKSISSSVIVDLALQRLAEIDKLSYDRLASNYLDETGQLRIGRHTDADQAAIAQLGLFRSDD
ncbi:MAG: ATP cone domain-containing protein [Myxococcota bacterium]